jgi:alkyl hydroperoxide reductase subunit AhpF
MEGIIMDRKKIIVAGLLLLVAGFAHAQDRDSILEAKRYRVRNIIWYTPSGAKEINGLAVGIQATSFNERKLTINGVNLDAGLLCAFVWPRALIKQLGSGQKDIEEKLFAGDSTETTFNGISISFGGEMAAAFNGISLNGLVVHSTYINGISVTGFVSGCRSFKGIVIGGISNVAVDGVGLQIGLFNNCKRLKGLQIGLWNRSGKRALPFINWGV